MCATDPPLVLTHIPLLKVPAGAVNVHGHLHRAAGPTDRHVNGMLEQGKVNFDLAAEAQRRESPTAGEASNGVLGRPTIGW